MLFSLFKNNRARKAQQDITIAEFLNHVKEGKWKRVIAKLRAIPKESPSYKRVKNALPAVTVSAVLSSRDEKIKTAKRVKMHSGLICLDLDRKDNPLLKTNLVLDKECLAQFVSCSGEGLKIIYKCKSTVEPSEHRRIFDSCVKRLEKIGVVVKVDPVVKSIASLQYVTHDPECYINLQTSLEIKPIKRKQVKAAPKIPKEQIGAELLQLNEFVDGLNGKDITQEYEDWMIVLFGLSYSFGDQGRDVMHKICASYKNYSQEECDEQYDACLERCVDGDIEKPITVASVFQLINNNLPKVQFKQLSKKYSVTHVVGEAGEVEPTQDKELGGLVAYGLFLYKKLLDKDTGEVLELIPHKLNLNYFEDLLRKLGFFRYEEGKVKFIRITDNIVDAVDVADILRILTDHVQEAGNVQFFYRRQEYYFSWEELAFKWREFRAMNTTWNQIAASLNHWQPDLLKDTIEASYVPYKNGVLEVTATSIKLINYPDIHQQIWRERILPRDFKLVKKVGMFEEFFANVCGRGENPKQRLRSSEFKRAMWYFGYMLQGTKRKSLSRAWMLYDVALGNNGRTGKTILGEAVGKIRSLITIDGKQFDIKNRFAFQTIQPWTDVVFIDDPSKYMSIVPLFNMISGDMTADRKNKNPLVLRLKFMFASNWFMEAEGSSEIGRQFITQVDSFYVRYGKKHGDSITPIVDYHGKEFFTDWDDDDWNQFDSFAAHSLQYHLKEEAPTNTPSGNASLMRFVQLNEEDMFFALATSFINNLKQSKEGDLLIIQQVLVETVKEHNDSIQRVRAGRIVRDFLHAIGAGKPQVTSAMVNKMTKMAYKLTVPFKDLDFGEWAERLPKLDKNRL